MLVRLAGQLREQIPTLEDLSNLSQATPGRRPVDRKPSSPPRPQRQLTSLELQDLVHRRLEGVKINDLATEFGVHRSTILRQLKERLP